MVENTEIRFKNFLAGLKLAFSVCILTGELPYLNVMQNLFPQRLHFITHIVLLKNLTLPLLRKVTNYKRKIFDFQTLNIVSVVTGRFSILLWVGFSRS